MTMIQEECHGVSRRHSHSKQDNYCHGRFMMSTIVVVEKEGFATIAADSLTTWGSAKESAEYILNHQKILRIGESYLAISGPTSAKLAIKDYFANKPDADLTSVDTIFRTWLKLHAALKDHYFLNPNEDRNDAFESTRIDALIANAHGIFGVEAHRVVQQFSRYYAYGTGWQHALAGCGKTSISQSRSIY